MRNAAEIARTLRLSGEDDDLVDDQPSLMGVSSPDLLRLDPVIVPDGPPPGLEPPRRRPKAFEPAPPTTFERGRARARRAARGDRGLVLIGVVGALVLVSLIGFLVSRSGRHTVDRVDETSAVRVLPIQRAFDFDPQGEDREENPKLVAKAIDGKTGTGWLTATYFGSPELGGLKEGVGLVLDLGGVREVDSLRIKLHGSPTDLEIYSSPETSSDPPEDVTELTQVASLGGSGVDASLSLPSGVETRYVVIWLTSLPRIADGSFRGEIREVVIRGRS
ncbi:discoidin domain-containing protein [Aeromicrobium sp. UC242_57]|uniref:discoidin domain-containing protein n=1 Tax=Aeromicrobium sp. UC242_57 TaxID=3374624 RepID=UPI0037BAA66E